MNELRDGAFKRRKDWGRGKEEEDKKVI